jgi:hypothetical protein
MPGLHQHFQYLVGMNNCVANNTIISAFLTQSIVTLNDNHNLIKGVPVDQPSPVRLAPLQVAKTRLRIALVDTHQRGQFYLPPMSNTNFLVSLPGIGQQRSMLHGFIANTKLGQDIAWIGF